MARGGFRPGSGRKSRAEKQAVAREESGIEFAARPKFEDSYSFGVWALNASDIEVTMDQKIRAMQTMAAIEMKKPAEAEKPKDPRAAAEASMVGRYAPRTVRGLGVVDGGK